MSRHRTVQKPFLRIFLSFLRSYYHNYGSVFSPWCFTHQYKNTTQFCFYAVPAASQNTNQKNTAPKNHASTANTYGLGSASSYGHVKLSDSYTASGGAAANGVCASSKAVNEVYKKFNEENTTNSGQNIQSITSSVDNYTDIKSIDISPGVYVAIARIEFQSLSATGDRKGRLAFSTSSGTFDLATECVRAASNNWARLSVCDIFKTNVSGSIKVQASQSSGSAINTFGCVTFVRLKTL